MNKLNVFSILLGLSGEAIIASVFFYFIPDHVLPDNIRILDFVVCTVAYGIWCLRFLRPVIKGNDASQKQIGGLGIRWIATLFYSLAAVIVVLYSLYSGWNGELTADSFNVYLIIQIVLFFVFLFGIVAAMKSEDMTKKVYEREETRKAGKQEVRQTVGYLLMVAEDSAGIPDEIKKRLRTLSEETRFITPSTTGAAVVADNDIINDCKILGPALSAYDINKSMIERYLSQLERDITRRRKTF